MYYLGLFHLKDKGVGRRTFRVPPPLDFNLRGTPPPSGAPNPPDFYFWGAPPPPPDYEFFVDHPLIFQME